VGPTTVLSGGKICQKRNTLPVMCREKVRHATGESSQFKRKRGNWDTEVEATEKIILKKRVGKDGKLLNKGEA